MAGYLIPGIGWVEDGESGNSVLYPGGSFQESEAAGGGSCTLTGSITTLVTESDITLGGETIILTLSGDTWVTAGAAFDAQRQAIIDGLTSAQTEGAGWNAVVKADEAVGSVVRTSDSVVTITLSAHITYDITVQEIITATVPASALTSASGTVASPTFSIDYTEAGFIPAWAMNVNNFIGAY